MKTEDEPGGLGEGILGQVVHMRQELARAQAELASETVEASAGNGAVRVVMNGIQECRSVTISPHLVAEGKARLVQDLVLSAVNQAIRDSQLLAARRLAPMTRAAGKGEGAR